jgi:hypothetical protein
MSSAGRTLAPRLNRRQFLKLGGLGAIALASGAGLDALVTAAAPRQPVRAPQPSPAGRRTFVSRPDLTPPVVSTARRAGTPLEDGLVLLTPGNGAAPDGLLIVTSRGEPVWIQPLPGKQTANLRVARYRGEPVLTWWEGSIAAGIGDGEHVIVDSAYREITRVRGGNGLVADLHEFIIGPDDHAFLLATRIVEGPLPAPSTSGSSSPGSSTSALSSPGSSHPARGPVLEGVIQELDIATGKVLFEWHSLPDIDPSESYMPVPTDGSAFDYLHANSIDVDGDGLVLSARHTSAVYRINRSTGAIDWRLGGRRSDFALPPEAQFAWQHDARVRPDGTISIFDNAANGVQPPAEPQSRGIVLEMDPATGRASLVKSFVHPDGVLATSQGSFEMLDDGSAFIGWGSAPRFTAFDAGGLVTLDASFAAAAQSYRSVLEDWRGKPARTPDVVVDRSRGRPAVYVSWNGATDVARWELLDATAATTPVAASVAATGFETVLVARPGMTAAVVRAIDARGGELVRSGLVTLA